MKHVNYDDIMAGVPQPKPNRRYDNVVFHKRNTRPATPKLSIVLLDWGVRERFDPLDWLDRQNAPRDSYELIWVELYDRKVPQVLEKADVAATCGQQGMYHKHIGYNVGLLAARGELVTVCDSDAVFPTDFVTSIFEFFYEAEGRPPKPAVLMHYEARSSLRYPESLADADELKSDAWQWWGLHPNAGACMTVPTADAIRFGGFDEDESLRGYLCGPYDLGWRMVNAGMPEVWYPPEKTMIYHFAHPDPIGNQGILPRLQDLFEITHPHVDLHAWAAVEAFSTGRLLPLDENPEIFERRMARRVIGTEFEAKYARMTSHLGFSPWQRRRLKLELVRDILVTGLRNAIPSNVRRLFGLITPANARPLARKARNFLREQRAKGHFRQPLALLRDGVRILRGKVQPAASRRPVQVAYIYAGYNCVTVGEQIIAMPQRLGAVDVFAPGALDRPEIIVGADLFALRAEIDQRPVERNDPPLTVYADYQDTGVSIVIYGNHCHGRRCADGPFADDGRNFSAETIGAVKAWARESGASETPEKETLGAG